MADVSKFTLDWYIKENQKNPATSEPSDMLKRYTEKRVARDQALWREFLEWKKARTSA